MAGDIKIFLTLALCAVGAFFLARLAFGRSEIDRAQIIAYVGMMLVAIFTKNAYAIFAVVLILKVVYLKGDLQRNLLFFVFLFPLMPVNVIQPFLSPGTAYFIDLNLQRVLTLFLLVPVLPTIRQMAQEKPGFYKLDLVFMALAAIFFVSFFREHSLYQVTLFFGVRESIGFLLDIAIPYFVLSRGLQHFGQLTQFARSIVLSGLLIALSGLFEAGMVWKFYFQLGSNVSSYAIAAIDSMYEWRGGFLRVSSSLGHPITFGFYMTLVMGFALFLLVYHRANFGKKAVILGLLAIGIFLTGSRGAWIGGGFLLMSYLFYSLGRGLRQLLIIQAVVVAVAVGLMYWNPASLKSSDQLDSIDQHGTFEYRARLFSTAIEVIPENLWWGTRTFRDHPKMQTMIQGQGIVDMVNGYIAIAIEYGIVALGLFAIMMLRVVTVGGKWVSLGDDYQYAAYRYLGAALITILLSFALQFAFTSYNGFVVNYLWLLFAFAKGFNYVYLDTLDAIDENDGAVPEYSEFEAEPQPI